jgi:hypothetical protein
MKDKTNKRIVLGMVGMLIVLGVILLLGMQHEKSASQPVVVVEAQAEAIQPLVRPAEQQAAQIETKKQTIVVTGTVAGGFKQ